MTSTALARKDTDRPVLLTYEEAAQRLDISKRSVQRRVNKGDLPAQVMGKHPNGKPKYGVPEVAIEDETVAQDIPNQAGDGQQTIPLTRDGLPDLAALRSLGLDQYADEWNRRMRAVSDASHARMRADYGEKTTAMRRVADMHGVGYRTLQRWYKSWKEGGPAALVPDWKNNRGETCLPVDLQLQIRESWLNSRRMSKAQVYREIVQPWYEENRPGECPHYSTVRRFINDHILPLEKTARREGPEEYQKQMHPRVQRDLPPVGEVWSADHRLWDVFVIVSDGQGSGWGRHDTIKCPCGSGKQRRNCCSLRRPWVTVLADVGSACFVGYRIGRNPNASGVCHAVRDGILDWGLPDWFCPDNGMEFKAKRLTREGKETYSQVMESGMWPTLGVEVHTALPYNAWSKPVESLFAAFSKQWENLCPGWCGRDAKDKPEQLDRQIKNGTILFWDQFQDVFEQQINRWNDSHTCGDREAPPAELYEQRWEDSGGPSIPSRDTLDFLIQDERRVKVRQEGIVLQAGGDKHRFTCEQIALYVGSKVTVRWDPERPEYVIAYTPDDRKIAVPPAENAQWGEWDEPNKEARRGARLQKNYLRERQQQVAGSTPPERLDPTGAVGMIRDRQAEQRTPDAKHLPDADQEAIEQQQALEDAKERQEEDNDDSTVYSQFTRDIA